jgi:hypothetical protein
VEVVRSFLSNQEDCEACESSISSRKPERIKLRKSDEAGAELIEMMEVDKRVVIEPEPVGS